MGAAFYSVLMLLAQAGGGGPAERPYAAIEQPWRSGLPAGSIVASVDPAPILLAQPDPGAGQPAEEAAGKQAGQKQQPQQQSHGWESLLLPMLAIGFLFYFLLIRPQRQEQRRRKEMLGGVKKNDRVVTIGGIYGVVTNVHKEADEVTIKVDETTNTKLRVTLASIARIMGDEPSGGSSSKQ